MNDQAPLKCIGTDGFIWEYFVSHTSYLSNCSAVKRLVSEREWTNQRMPLRVIHTSALCLKSRD